jgi:hypothetical protein
VLQGCICLEHGSTARVLPYIDWSFLSVPRAGHQENTMAGIDTRRLNGFAAVKFKFSLLETLGLFRGFLTKRPQASKSAKSALQDRNFFFSRQAFNDPLTPCPSPPKG